VRGPWVTADMKCASHWFRTIGQIRVIGGHTAERHWVADGDKNGNHPDVERTLCESRYLCSVLTVCALV
jgi:hypothetical protein